MLDLTARERRCLEFLDPRIKATSAAIGEVVAPLIPDPINQRRYGVVIAACLWDRKPPLVKPAEGLDTWRITDAGRAALKEPADVAD